MKRRTFRAFPFFLLILFFVSSPSDISYGQRAEDDHYMKGVGYAVEGKFEDADKEFEDALRINPHLFYATACRAIIQNAIYNTIQKETAISIFKGIDYSNKDKFKEAIEEFNQAIDREPEYPYSYNERAIVYDLTGQPGKALADFAKVIELAPKYELAYIGRGRIYMRLELYDKAIDDLSKAIALNPYYPLAYYNRGWIYGAKRDMYDKAVEDFDRAIKIDPKFADAYVDRGICCVYQKRYDDAIADFNKAIDVDPRNIRAHWNRSICFEEMGRKPEAIASYQSVLQYAPATSVYYDEARIRIKELER